MAKVSKEKALLEDQKEEKYSGVERILFFATPIVFTVILLGVLLTLFNVNWRNTVLSWAENIPVVNQWVDAAGEDEKQGADSPKKDTAVEQPKSDAKKVEELKELLASKDADLRNLASARKELETQVTDLKKQVSELKQKRTKETANAEQYDKQIKDLADMYARMMPSKAAPILENLATEEIVLVLDAMKQENRVKVLEKMNPKVAADASIMLKDVMPSENLQVKALQARLNKQEPAKKTHNGLDQTSLSKTFTSMTPKNGATVILETAKISPEKALAVLNAVDDDTRSKLLNAMTEIDKVKTTSLVSKLLPNK
ncbi:MotE family protein [Paenibacillus sp. 481]|uniref:MotE family protein n=1 Tax=Paenibacillus sp. 481 TaxID=2835869 RepID=UPI001E434425|nr:primosomal protein [Paenibacillus sp. 481]